MDTMYHFAQTGVNEKVSEKAKGVYSQIKKLKH